MNILIPTDFSEYSKHAINYVHKHFDVSKLNIKLIHTIKEPHSTSGVLIRLDQLMMKDAQKEMLQLVDKIEEVYGNRLDYLLKYGHLKNWVENYAESMDIDLIVMGTKGATNVSSKIMGSVTESLIRTSKVPILAIPELKVDRPIHRFVLATDKKVLENQDFVEQFIDSLKLSNPHIDVLTIIRKNHEGGFPKSIPLKGYQFGVELRENDSVVDGINDFLNENEIDILGLYHSHNSRLDYLFNRSITRTICGKCKQPLLVIPAKG